MAQKALLWLKKTSAVLALLMLVAGVGIQAGLAAAFPSVTSSAISAVSFNPNNGEQVVITYQLDMGGGNVTVIINDASGNTRRTFTNAPNSSSQANYVNWNGRDDSNNIVPAGNYTYTIKPNSNGVGYASGSVQVTTGGSSNNNAPVVTSISAPSSFNVSNGEQATVTYYLDRQAYSVQAQILDSSNSVRRTFSNLGTNSGNQGNTFTWDGRDDSNNMLSTGTYTILVKASDSSGNYGTNSRSIVLNGSNNSYGMVNITSVNANPSTINQNNNEQTVITYYLDRQAYSAYVEIFDQNNNRQRYFSNTTTSVNQTNTVLWNGRDDNGNILPGGTYTVVVSATNSYGTSKNNSARITLSSGTSNSCGYINGSMPTLNNVYATPTTINTYSNDTSTIYYAVDRISNVTIQVLDVNNSVLKTLVNNVCQNTLSTNNFVSWDGRDSNGNFVASGNYTVRVSATTTPSYQAVKYVYIQVNNNGNNGGGSVSNGTIIRDLMVSPEVFNPRNGQIATAYYNLTQNATVTVDILDRNGNYIRNLVSNVSRYSSNYTYTNTFGRYNYGDTWNGIDANGNISDNIYQFRIRAVGSNGVTDTQTAWVEVNTDGVIIGFPTSQDCAGFRDVSSTSPYCKALQAMRDVFQGYNDQTFRPYQLINRAEVSAVIARAFDLQQDTTNYSLGFRDTDDGAWYASYLRVARRLNIIRGYPDGTFRPAQTVNRVELAKIFTETARAQGIQLMTYCSGSPFVDVPLTADNNWVLNYACTMKRWNLMSDDGRGRFNATAYMTRGDVLDLFYRYQTSGLNQGVNSYNSNSNYYNLYSYTPVTYNPSMYYSPYSTTPSSYSYPTTTYYNTTPYYNTTTNPYYYQDYVQY